MTIPYPFFTLIDCVTSQKQAFSLKCHFVATFFKEQKQFACHIQGATACLLRCDNINHKAFAGLTLGEREFKEISEIISMGLTVSRDGRSLTKGRKRELVILPSEIQPLKKREAYVKFREHNPVLLKVEITKANRLPDVTEPFIMRPGLTLESIIKRQEEISIKASALTEGVEISEEPDGSREKTEVLLAATKETEENDFPVENEPVEEWNNR